jgi:hypothetical protein
MLRPVSRRGGARDPLPVVPATRLMRLRTLLLTTAVLAGLAAGALAPISAEAATTARIRSPGDILVALEAEGFVIDEVRRKAQVYFVRARLDGVSAILAVDGRDAELIGVTVLGSATDGTAARSRGPARVDLSRSYGYVIEVATYESWTEVSSVEWTSTEDYVEVTYEENEEISYGETTLEESVGFDATEESEAAEVDGTAEETVDEGSVDDGTDDGVADDGADEPLDDAAPDEGDGEGFDDGGSDDEVDDGGAEEGGDDMTDDGGGGDE